MNIKEYIWRQKYRQEEEETLSDTYRRVANYISKGVKLSGDFSKIFFELMNENRFIPGGRILANAGTKIKNLGNCFVISVRDSRDSIFKALADSAQIFAWGGGIGYNFSHLRERGAPISIGGQSSGVLSFMKLFDDVAEVIKIRSRRGAMMGQLDVSHPEIRDFIRLKSSLTQKQENIIKRLEGLGMDEENIYLVRRAFESMNFNHFNISVRFTDDFFEAVLNDGDWKLISPLNDEVKEVVKAKNLLEEIAYQAWASGDPGFVFLDRINRDELMYDVWGPPESSNPCLRTGTLMINGNRLFKFGHVSDSMFTGEYAWTESGPSPIYDVGEFLVWRTGYKDIIRLRTNAGLYIDLTPDHKVLVAEGKNGEYEYRWVRADQTLGKKVVLGIRDYNEVKRTKPLNKEAALLGFLFGDGTFESRRFYIRVDINPDNEPEVAELLTEFGFKKIDIGKSFYKFRMKVSDFIEKFGDKAYELIQNTYEKKIPEWVFDMDIDWIRDFLVGVFEANGSVNRNGQILFKTISEELVNQLQQLLLLFGMFAWKVRNKRNKVEWYNGEYISRESWNLQIAPRNAKVFKYTIGFLSERKNGRIKEFDSKYGMRVKVVSIEHIGKDWVWDFKMKDSRDWNYAQGFIVHNCSELYLYPYESCVLGSVNLLEHTKISNGEWEIDWPKLAETVFYATIFLDAVVEMNENIVEELNRVQKYLRRIGLGVMGWADLLLRLEIPYGSERSLELAKTVMWFITMISVMTSNFLARKVSPAPFWNDYKYNLNTAFLFKLFSYVGDGYEFKEAFRNLRKFAVDHGLEEFLGRASVYPLRNVSWTSLAPTGSISILAGVSQAIEPHFKLVYKRNVELGEDVVQKTVYMRNAEVDRKLREDFGLSEDEIVDFYDEYLEGGIEGIKVLPKEKSKIFVDAQSLSPRKHIDMQAALQEFTSNSISKTVNLPKETTPEEVRDLIIYMWRKGIKSSTIYRDGSKLFQILE